MEGFVTNAKLEIDSPEENKVTAADAGLTEDLALALLKRPDLAPDFLTKLGKNSSLLKHRKVKLALVAHPRTPRHLVLPVLRHLFTFDLMRVALMPTIAADIKVAAETSLINRLEKLSLGEKVSLARRASGRVAAALLNDTERRVVDVALQNSRLTEAAVLKELTRKTASSQLIFAVCDHAKWKLRREIGVALLRNENTPTDHTIEITRSLPAGVVTEIIEESDLPESAKSRLYAAASSKVS